MKHPPDFPFTSDSSYWIGKLNDLASAKSVLRLPGQCGEYLLEPASQLREQRPRPRLPDLATKLRRLASDLTLDRMQRGDASDGLSRDG